MGKYSQIKKLFVCQIDSCSNILFCFNFFTGDVSIQKNSPKILPNLSIIVLLFNEIKRKTWLLFDEISMKNKTSEKGFPKENLKVFKCWIR
jgi:hypothetical protein